MARGVVPPALCGVVLACIIGAELYGAGGGAPASHAPAAMPVPPRGGDAPDGRRQAGWVATVLARPLFSPSRRLAADMAQGEQVLRLAGIITSPAGRKAIFAVMGAPEKTGAQAGAARGLPVGEGGQAGPWRVRHIGAWTVEVEGAAGPVTLRPERAHAAHAASPPGMVDGAAPDPSDSDEDIVIPESRFPAVPPRPDPSHP
ncbi:hypothetical protein JCM25156A_27460 [Komagataeibacter kakiaceti JCM 25156]